MNYLFTDRAKVQEAGAETSGRRIELTRDGNSSVTPTDAGQSKEQKDLLLSAYWAKINSNCLQWGRGLNSHGYFGFQGHSNCQLVHYFNKGIRTGLWVKYFNQ